jgi:hypothetical protein
VLYSAAAARALAGSLKRKKMMTGFKKDREKSTTNLGRTGCVFLQN